MRTLRDLLRTALYTLVREQRATFARVACGEAGTPAFGRSGAFGLRVVRRRLELRCPGSVFHLQSSREGTSAIVEVPVTPGGTE